MTSIRRRLVIILLGVVIITGSITVLLSYKDAQHEVGELFDAQLAQSARVLDALIIQQVALSNAGSVDFKKIQNIINHITVLNSQRANGLKNKKNLPEDFEYERKIAFQMWGVQNNLLILRSASAPVLPLSTDSLKTNRTGFFNTLIDKKRWRVFSTATEDKKYIMQVGEQYDIRDELTEDISAQLIKSSLFALPVLALLIWGAIRKGLAPLGRITSEVSKRNKENFDAINLKQIPLEIKPLIQSINDLLARLKIAFESERRFTDDAAHELRTPLAGLKTQAQVALAANNNDDKAHALEKIIQGVDRASHLVDQMLVIARLEKYSVSNESINLYQIINELISQFESLVNEKKLTFCLEGDKNVVVHTDITSLIILLNNLLDNAVRYSSSSTEIIINIQQNGKAELSISNCGESIPEADLKRVFDRFYRVPGSPATGCGLGLAISKQVAEMQNIKLTIENKTDNSGVIARLVWI